MSRLATWILLVGLAATPAAGSGPAAAPPVVDLVMFGDWGAPSAKLHRQRRVAEALARWVTARPRRPDAVVLLGDNFYGKLTGVTDPRWDLNFSQMYPRSVFPMPFYFILGNHDYEDNGGKSARMELDYRTKGRDDRWQLPAPSPRATWGRVELPPAKPILTLFLLGNSTDNIIRFSNPKEFAEPLAGWNEEVSWVRSELAKPHGRWLAAASHFPPWSYGAHFADDGPRPSTGPWHNDPVPWKQTRADLLPLFTAAGAQFWFGGHDHCLQHLTRPEAPGMRIVVSGAGGGDSLYGRHPLAPTDTYLRKSTGWLHMQFTETTATGTFWYLPDADKPGEPAVAVSDPSFGPP